MRSGSTLQYNITCQLLTEANMGEVVEYLPPKDHDLLIDREKKGTHSIFKTHKLTPFVQKQFEQGNACGIYIYRDIRDVCVSLMNQKSEPFETILKWNFIQEYVEDFTAWIGQKPLLISRYEEAKPQVVEETLRIASFLKIKLSEDRIRAIGEGLTIDKQKSRIEQMAKEKGEGIYDKKTLLHYNHIQSGAFYQWLYALRPHQIAQIESIAGNWLKDNGYLLYDEIKAQTQYTCANEEDLLLLHYFTYRKDGKYLAINEANSKAMLAFSRLGWKGMQWKTAGEAQQKSVAYVPNLLYLGGAERFNSIIPLLQQFESKIEVVWLANGQEQYDAKLLTQVEAMGYSLARVQGKSHFFVHSQKLANRLAQIDLRPAKESHESMGDSNPSLMQRLSIFVKRLWK